MRRLMLSLLACLFLVMTAYGQQLINKHCFKQLDAFHQKRSNK